jgi:hypothetical protein
MKAEKKKRSKVNKDKIDNSKPLTFTLMDLGGPNDPCWGTHDPKDSECRACGDSEFCQIVKAQRNHGLRKEQEKKVKFKDKDYEEHLEFNEKTLIKFVKAKMKKGYDQKKVTRMAIKKFTPYISNFLVETKVENEYSKIN